jgi:hypothetical protein
MGEALKESLLYLRGISKKFETIATQQSGTEKTVKKFSCQKS